MWMVWILAVTASLSGYYLLNNEMNHPVPPPMKGAAIADNMSIYRAAVIAYAVANPNFIGSVADASLVFPIWYVPISPSSLWSNYIAPDGTIIIYARTLPSTKITTYLVKLSQNSILAGEAKSASGTLYSPIDTNGPAIMLPTGVAIPDGAPVWLAHR